MAVRTLADPDAETAARFLRHHVPGHLVQVFGACTVLYEGRASSTLGDGERILLLKPDGALLVHQAHGVKPANWQPPGTAFAFEVEVGARVVTGLPAQPRALGRVRVHEVP
ncbi:MAG: endonuclease NucS, partial [Methanobacteriota archaeon]